MQQSVRLIMTGFLFLGSTAVSFAQIDLSTTELIKVSGKVEVQKGEDPAYKAVPANLKLAGALKRLDSGDKVKTRDNSGAEMVLKDTCVLGVKENSQFEVPATLGAGALTKLKAQQGSFLFKVVSGSGFKVQTSEVIAGVKGTLFEVEITDNLAPFLKLPGLDLGLENPGGTLVNVYEGEVELNHAVTGKRRTVKAGERLAVLNRLLTGLDKSLAEGFGPLEKFEVLKQLQQNFGAGGLRFLKVPSSIKGIGALSTEGFELVTRLGDRNQRREALVRLLPAPLQEKIGRFQELRSLAQSFKVEAFKPTFDEGKYPTTPQRKLIAENGLEEAHIGSGLFMAMAPNPGCQVLKLEPEDKAYVLKEGEGSFRIQDFAHDLKGAVVVRNEGGKLITTASMEKGTLYTRLPGDSNTVAVQPGKPVSIEFDPAAGTSRFRPAAGAVSLSPQLAGYRFQVETDLEAQKSEHQQKANQKRGEAAKNLLQNAPKMKDKLKGALRKFW